MHLTDWIPAVRRLRSDLRATADARIRAEDEVRALRNQVVTLQAQVTEALLDGRAARERVADWIAQYNFGRVVFGPNALPEDTPPASPRRRLHGRELVAQAERELYEALHEPRTDPTAPSDQDPN